jgi:hypothetical protein
LSEWLNGTLDFVPVRAIEPGGFFLVARPDRAQAAGAPGIAADGCRAARGRRLFDMVILDAVPCCRSRTPS